MQSLNANPIGTAVSFHVKQIVMPQAVILYTAPSKLLEVDILQLRLHPPAFVKFKLYTDILL